MPDQNQTAGAVPAEWQRLISRFDRSAAYHPPKVGRHARRAWPHELRELMAESQNHRCPYCGCTMDKATSNAAPTFEHVKPLCRGGADCITNLVIVCADCNGKASRDMHLVRRNKKRRRRMRDLTLKAR